MNDISIIIPSFNRASLVTRAINSCLDSGNLCVEVIVVDDGSTDETQNILNSQFGRKNVSHQVKNHMVKWLAQNNQGACSARNLGLREATGKYVKFLDSDDYLLPSALTQEYKFAENTKVDVVVTGWQEIYYPKNNQTLIKCVPAPIIDDGIDDMLLGKAPITSAALYRHDFIKEKSIKWNPVCKKAQEWEWAWTVCLEGAIFKSLNIESYVHDNGNHDRIGNLDNAYLLSIIERQRILRMVESKLKEKNLLNENRKKLLSQYYYKDRLALYKIDPEKLKELLNHCYELSSTLPDEKILMIRLLSFFLPRANSIILYEEVKNLFKTIKLLKKNKNDEVI